MPGPTPVVIDTDAGIDDVVALALAARSSTVEVLGVTTTYGNTDLSRASRNARHVLDLAGLSHIPVIPGADRPLHRPPPRDVGRHGPEGTGGAPVTAASKAPSRPDAILELLRRCTRPVTMITLGPLTNLAHALDRDGALVRHRVSRLVAAAGNFGDAASAERHAEFNAWCDPEAAGAVLGAGMALELVPLDVSSRFALSGSDLNEWLDADAPLTRWLGAAIRWRTDSMTGAATLPDVVAVAAGMDQGVLTLAKRRIGIDLDEDPRRGRCREGTGVEVCIAADVSLRRVRTLVREALWRPGGPEESGKEAR